MAITNMAITSTAVTNMETTNMATTNMAITNMEGIMATTNTRIEVSPCGNVPLRLLYPCR